MYFCARLGKLENKSIFFTTEKYIYAYKDSIRQW